MKVSVDLGSGITAWVEDANVKKALFQAINLTGNWCHSCKEQGGEPEKEIGSFRLQANEGTGDTGTFIYIKRICPDCGGRSTLGEFQDNKGNFWKKFEVYDPDAKKGSGKYQAVADKITGDNEPPPAGSEEDDSDKLPF